MAATWVLAVCPLLFGACVTSRAAQDGYYDDWWLCAENCGEEDADCIDACTEEFNETHSTKRRKVPSFRLQRRSDDEPAPLPGDFVFRCPEGTVLSPFPMPIYDEDGLFVIGYETVWYCLPEEYEPVG